MTNAELHAMPWTASLMTTDELFEWLASRKGAARNIDIESCELGQWRSSAADPYGVLEMSSEDSSAKWFVRSPESCGWIAAVRPAGRQIRVHVDGPRCAARPGAAGAGLGRLGTSQSLKRRSADRIMRKHHIRLPPLRRSPQGARNRAEYPRAAPSHRGPPHHQSRRAAGFLRGRSRGPARQQCGSSILTLASPRMLRRCRWEPQRSSLGAFQMSLMQLDANQHAAIVAQLLLQQLRHLKPLTRAGYKHALLEFVFPICGPVKALKRVVAAPKGRLHSISPHYLYGVLWGTDCVQSSIAKASLTLNGQGPAHGAEDHDGRP